MDDIISIRKHCFGYSKAKTKVVGQKSCNISYECLTEQNAKTQWIKEKFFHSKSAHTLVNDYWQPIVKDIFRNAADNPRKVKTWMTQVCRREVNAFKERIAPPVRDDQHRFGDYKNMSIAVSFELDKQKFEIPFAQLQIYLSRNASSPDSLISLVVKIHKDKAFSNLIKMVDCEIQQGLRPCRCCLRLPSSSTTPESSISPAFITSTSPIMERTTDSVEDLVQSARLIIPDVSPPIDITDSQESSVEDALPEPNKGLDLEEVESVLQRFPPYILRGRYCVLFEYPIPADLHGRQIMASDKLSQILKTKTVSFYYNGAEVENIRDCPGLELTVYPEYHGLPSDWYDYPLGTVLRWPRKLRDNFFDTVNFNMSCARCPSVQRKYEKFEKLVLVMIEEFEKQFL